MVLPKDTSTYGPGGARIELLRVTGRPLFHWAPAAPLGPGLPNISIPWGQNEMIIAWTGREFKPGSSSFLSKLIYSWGNGDKWGLKDLSGEWEKRTSGLMWVRLALFLWLEMIDKHLLTSYTVKTLNNITSKQWSWSSYHVCQVKETNIVTPNREDKIKKLMSTNLRKTKWIISHSLNDSPAFSSIISCQVLSGPWLAPEQQWCHY